MHVLGCLKYNWAGISVVGVVWPSDARQACVDTSPRVVEAGWPCQRTHVPWVLRRKGGRDVARHPVNGGTADKDECRPKT